MTSRPPQPVTNRLATSVSPEQAMTMAAAWAMCPGFSGASAFLSAWQAIYAQARADAERTVATRFPGRRIEPSMN